MNREYSSVAIALALSAGGALAQSQVIVSDTNSKVVRYAWPTGQALDHFIGAGISSLNNAHDMLLAPDGRLYVASLGNNSVIRYESGTGFFSDTFVTPGFGGLSQPSGMTLGPDGWLYVSSLNNSRIIRYNTTSGASEQFVPATGGSTGGLNRPFGLAFGPDGHLYVASRETDRVLRYNGATGDFMDVVVGPDTIPISRPTGLLFDADGFLFVASRGTDSVIRVDINTLDAINFVTSGSGGLSDPQFMRFHPSADASDRTLLVVMSGGSGRVLRYNAFSGQFLGVLIESNAGGLGNNPMSILVLPDSEPCRADFNGDGLLNFFDVSAFINEFNLGCP
ncbi:MAG: NHL repeat-containing protein [Phycisphaerales bacterium]|nr:NHL repeat-containing protein [Planctomycetota bacterium]MCH8508853.1 NHL repeat-containing protein [Phycisphaerales bacterium]